MAESACHSAYNHKVGIRTEIPEVDPNLWVIRSWRNLLAAILSRAINDQYSSTSIDSHTRRSARVWLNSPIEINEPFTFGWIANQLDLDPEELRVILHNYSKNPEKMRECLHLLS